MIKLFLPIKKHQNIFNGSLKIINRYNNFSKLNQYIFLRSTKNFSGEKCLKFVKFFFFFFATIEEIELKIHPRERFHLSSMNRENCIILENSLWAYLDIFLSFYIYPPLNLIFINSFLINKIRVDIHLPNKLFRIFNRGVLLDESRPRLKAKFSNHQEVRLEERFVESRQKFLKIATC